MGGSIEQDAALLQRLAGQPVARQPFLEHLVIGLGRCRHQRYAPRAQRIHGGAEIIGGERDVLDALAVEAQQVFVDLTTALTPFLVERDADLVVRCGHGA